VERAPLHHADHCGDLIVVADADLGMGIVWSAEGAQKYDVLLKLGQGRAAGKSPQVLARIFVLRSHRPHLHGVELACERAPADLEGVAEPYRLPHHAPRDSAWAGPKGPKTDLTLACSAPQAARPALTPQAGAEQAGGSAAVRIRTKCSDMCRNWGGGGSHHQGAKSRR